jgi:hypothetical protein
MVPEPVAGVKLAQVEEHLGIMLESVEPEQLRPLLVHPCFMQVVVVVDHQQLPMGLVVLVAVAMVHKIIAVPLLELPTLVAEVAEEVQTMAT